MNDSNAKFKPAHPNSLRRRLNYAAVVILLLFAALLIRLAYLQIYRGDEFRLRSDTNSIRMHNIISPRGLIVDRNGIILAENIPSFNAVYVPNQAMSYGEIKKEIARIYRERSLEIPREISTPRNLPVFVSQVLDRDISIKKVAVLETKSHLLPGLTIEAVPIRRYPFGDLFSHLIGHVGEITPEELRNDTAGLYSSGNFLGKSGLERSRESFLRGKSGARQTEVNALGQEVQVLGKIEPVAGYNVILTIDSSLQEAVRNAMAGRVGGALVMDPRDGAVLAMVSYPTFDPNIFSRRLTPDSWRQLTSDPWNPLTNRVISAQYPPASTYKIILAAAALEEGLITEDTTFTCDGEFEFGDRSFRCWNRAGHGRVNLHRALVVSCDVYFYYLGLKLGVDTIARYAELFGFGRRTGIELPHERMGLVPTRQWKMDRFKQPWLPGETLSVAIGQGANLATLLQMAQAYSALANGGKLYRPRIVNKIQYPDGRIHREYQPEALSTLNISQSTIQIINRALWGAVNEPGGTAPVLMRGKRDVSGKTGTAQVVRILREGEKRRVAGGGRRLQNHAMFVGFAPSDNPEITVAVIIEHAGGGGAVAAPVARKIVDAYFALKRGETSLSEHRGTGNAINVN